MMRIPVTSGGRSTDYEVVVEAGARHQLIENLRRVAPKVRRWAVISDSNVAPLHGESVARRLEDAGLGGEVHTFLAGERNKTREKWSALTDALLGSGLGRDGGVVAVGGGVTGDLAGFVAATFMRGIPVVQLPTSLVAMIDASVGGKTGVDTAHGKNLVGAFHPPRLVLADPETIATLPRAERAQGLAEALKHGAIADEEHFEEIVAEGRALLDGEVGAVGRIVSRSVAIKASVVSQDEREAGLREVLNFGHTLGHALELDSDFELPHGSAVALGMLMESSAGEIRGVTRAGTTDRLSKALASVELPAQPESVDPARIAELTTRDKKARGHPRMVLLDRIGSVAAYEGGWSHPWPVDEIEAILRDLAG